MVVGPMGRMLGPSEDPRMMRLPAIAPVLGALLLFTACSDDGGTRSLGGGADGGDSDGRIDGGGAEDAGTICAVECSRCPPPASSACEAAAAECDDAECCAEVEASFDCSTNPPPPPVCAFDCSQCLEAGQRDRCQTLESLCANVEDVERIACCESLSLLFESCDEMMEPGSCFDCTQCTTPRAEGACEAAAEGCGTLPPAQREACCTNIPAVIPACDPDGGEGGACGLDCAACPPDVEGTCDTEQAECGRQSGIQRVQCCQDVLQSLGGLCIDGGDNSCEVDCSTCPSASGRRACELGREGCENIPDPAASAECCRTLEENLEFVCTL